MPIPTHHHPAIELGSDILVLALHHQRWEINSILATICRHFQVGTATHDEFRQLFQDLNWYVQEYFRLEWEYYAAMNREVNYQGKFLTHYWGIEVVLFREA